MQLRMGETANFRRRLERLNAGRGEVFARFMGQ